MRDWVTANLKRSLDGDVHACTPMRAGLAGRALGGRMLEQTCDTLHISPAGDGEGLLFRLLVCAGQRPLQSHAFLKRGGSARVH
jgi:hypothetical protein